MYRYPRRVVSLVAGTYSVEHAIVVLRGSGLGHDPKRHGETVNHANSSVAQTGYGLDHAGMPHYTRHLDPRPSVPNVGQCLNLTNLSYVSPELSNPVDVASAVAKAQLLCIRNCLFRANKTSLELVGPFYLAILYLHKNNRPLTTPGKTYTIRTM
jgi:hypothetical protein